MFPPDTAQVGLLPNLGDKSARLLRHAGILTVGDLRQIGPVEAYRRLLVIGEQPSLVLLWAMVAGMRGEHWLHLTDYEKQELRAQLREE
ncbi:hypothetical protein GCM10008955_10330 [Deinococcus malanensis]|uniref:TfoX C-terminal domain-containing protein n=1 Tax=Deinococcus malanensis TaxID=1706855 RepID=A0ABQ2EP84_9DEIO|nr:TfoX/Sxy family protein [Deinococcus malanensis]GGK18870.1 hypothetical protein GCM10008955_10330 [Deinococcus malanensis]